MDKQKSEEFIVRLCSAVCQIKAVWLSRIQQLCWGQSSNKDKQELIQRQNRAE